jgi:putative ABC transport system permease protein
LKYFTIIAVFIACLGLLGLASFTSERYTKEIGIRKVLGSSEFSIFILLTKEFIKWVVVANLIALPVAYYLAEGWLQSFVYRVDIEPWVFILSCSLALIITLLTVAYHTIKAATVNPVKSLRCE